ncbi:uncharacterized protein [Dermacentor albipictus]|uniref:uncharacterized protein isoform X2 n=1 Tax=Dermacentor albipictus TaxID=60249 RepID=UPI0038FC37DB
MPEKFILDLGDWPIATCLSPCSPHAVQKAHEDPCLPQDSSDRSSQMYTEEAAHVSESTEAREFQQEVLTWLSVLRIVQQQQGEWLTALPTRRSVKETDKAPGVVVGYKYGPAQANRWLVGQCQHPC